MSEKKGRGRLYIAIFLIFAIVVIAGVVGTRMLGGSSTWTLKPMDWGVYSESDVVLGSYYYEIELPDGRFEIRNPSNCKIFPLNEDPEKGKVGLPIDDSISAPTGTVFKGSVLLSASCTEVQKLPDDGGLYFKPLP